MSVYARFKRGPEGFRHLVELLEVTPKARRDRMIEVGMLEDATFTEKALSYVITFEDILGMNEMELAELLGRAQPRIVAYAIALADQSVQERFLKCARPQAMAAIRDFLGNKVAKSEVGAAQLSLIGVVRQLEREGFLSIKKIPMNINT